MKGGFLIGIGVIVGGVCGGFFGVVVGGLVGGLLVVWKGKLIIILLD